MRKMPSNIADLSPEVQAFIAEQLAQTARLQQELLGLTLSHTASQKHLKAKRQSFSQAIQNRDLIIADLRMQLDGHKKHRFGSRSERSDQLSLDLIQEEQTIGAAADAPIDEDPATEPQTKEPRTPRHGYANHFPKI